LTGEQLVLEIKELECVPFSNSALTNIRKMRHLPRDSATRAALSKWVEKHEETTSQPPTGHLC